MNSVRGSISGSQKLGARDWGICGSIPACRVPRAAKASASVHVICQPALVATRGPRRFHRMMGTSVSIASQSSGTFLKAKTPGWPDSSSTLDGGVDRFLVGVWQRNSPLEGINTHNPRVFCVDCKFNCFFLKVDCAFFSSGRSGLSVAAMDERIACRPAVPSLRRLW